MALGHPTLALPRDAGEGGSFTDRVSELTCLRNRLFFCFRCLAGIVAPPITPQRKQFPKQKCEDDSEYENQFYDAVWNIFHSYPCA
jgi:hypothetical protein